MLTFWSLSSKSFHLSFEMILQSQFVALHNSTAVHWAPLSLKSNTKQNYNSQAKIKVWDIHLDSTVFQ